MKILLPISSPLDLTVAAVAAVALHAVVLGFGFGPGEPMQNPQPKLKRVIQCDSLTLVTPEPTRVREPMEKQDREVKEKVVRESPEKPTASHRRQIVPEKKYRARLAHKEKVKVQKDKPVIREREKAPPEEDTPEEAAAPKPTLPTAISRAAAPAVEDGYEFDYPRLARRYNYEGTVVLEVTVSAEGKVLDVALKASSGYACLDKSAQRQMWNVPFTPALTRAGLPMESTVEQVVNFTLESPAPFPE
jgi:protein TonB